jgi:hypothetical protein
VLEVDELAHVTEKEGEQKRPYMGTVDVSIGHKDNVVIAYSLRVEVIIDTGADGGDDGAYFLVSEHFIRRGFFHVKNLTAQR